jgi:hypothetical protein
MSTNLQLAARLARIVEEYPQLDHFAEGLLGSAFTGRPPAVGFAPTYSHRLVMELADLAEDHPALDRPIRDLFRVMLQVDAPTVRVLFMSPVTAEEVAMVADGDKIGAIRSYRDRHPGPDGRPTIGLREAKEAVEAAHRNSLTP